MELPEKKEAILQAMLELITVQGVHATPMSQVAKQAKVAAGTIYHYFASKEALLNELYLLKKQQLGQVLRTIDTSGNYKQQFFNVYRALYNYFIENPMIFKFAEQIASSPLITEETRKAGEKYYAVSFDFFRAGIQAGILREMNLHLMKSLVYGSVVAVVSLQVTQELEITDQLLEEAIQACWDGIRIN